ncbi:phosphonate metabolism protein/1,5-bisphosphokinase (PRPP-forming) PhnN [Methylobrevis albus]|uniref:Ribose 1,5-bisphosphate phosphokinase PhnN n=1 Tax=Methylobrevis albus TaxID=2793297 RepID=A0A931I1M3_9HYPH|nr:phosphonate metabolism protein/1,5-bisphosphokinase (PRPP-forming) PhnN [Methylobrevis albus]MBH0238560.1 phosphonate metabolism protein/1,5-bisphosphokinase (PRPP-forming) PhnN [Methylobrevis albus]
MVCGPSGAGKDTLLALVRAELGAEPGYRFVRRTITRLPDDNEDSDFLDDAAFDAAVAAGRFAIHWRAHGLGYGLPAEIDAGVAAGEVVVANVSRDVLDAGRARYPRTLVLHVTAPAPVLAARLAARGRESAADILARLDRADACPVEGADVVDIVNDGAPEAAAARMAAGLRSLSGG